MRIAILSSVVSGALGLLPAAASEAPPAGASGIGLTIANPLPFARAGEPVTCGVPLPPGFARSPEELVLLGPDGKPVPVQVQRTGAYGSGVAPRWVLLDFLAELPANGSAAYRLAPGRGNPRGKASISRSVAGGIVRIDTGAASFSINVRRFRLFDSVKVGGRELLGDPEEERGAFLETADGKVLAADLSAGEAAFEDSGPLRATLRVRGRLGTDESGIRAAYTCRMHFFAGASFVRVCFALHNPAAHHHPGNIWDLGSGGSLFLEDLSLVLPLGSGSSRARVSGHAGSLERVTIYQDSSGGENWRSANHVDKDLKISPSFRGYRVWGGEEQLAAGDRVDGWVHARGEAGGLAAAVRDFWQNFPKALSFEGGKLRVGLWPRESAGAHEILGGERKTHEVLFHFHGPEVEDDAVEARLRSFQTPVYAMPEPEAVLATRALSPTAPLDRERYGKLEATCDTAVAPRGDSPETIQTRWEAIDEYGWRHFGDTFADNERAPEAMVRDFPEHHPGGLPISHFVNEYDVIYAVMLHGIRRADPAWFRLADRLARHHADICVNHTAEDAPAYSHGPFMHTTHDTAAYRSTFRSYPIEAKRYGLRYGQGGGPNAGHCYVACLAQHWWLMGDRSSLEAFLEVAEWAAESPWFSKDMMGDQRGFGNLLTTLVYAYQLTGERRFYDRALTLVGWVEKPFAGLGGNLFAKAAGRFLDMKRDRGEEDAASRKVRDLLVAFGEHYLTLPESEWAGYLEQRCFHAEVLSTAYLHAPADHPSREAFREAAAKILDEALDRFPGQYVPVKTWVMCFANTGAYLKARR